MLIAVTKHESSSESAIKTESTLLDHSKDDNIVKLDGSGAGVMDTEDISLSLSQSSNFGRSDMFKNDSLLLGKLIPHCFFLFCLFSFLVSCLLM